MQEQNKKFKISVELVRCESLKPEVRDEHNLPDKGVVVQKILKNSPLTISYEEIKGGLAGFLTQKLKGCNMQPLVKACRERFG